MRLMARSHLRKLVHGGNGRRTSRQGLPDRRNPLTISFAEAARLLDMQPRTLRLHLKRTDARCLVVIGNRYRIDRKGFFRWCRLLGFESAGRLGGV